MPLAGSEQELEAAVVKLKSWHPSVEEGELAQAWIDWLDNTISSVNADSVLYARSLIRLQKLCRYTERLPVWCTLPTMTYDPRPISSSAYSDVYCGQWNGRPVALKALRLHVDDQAKVTKAFHNEVVAWRHLNHRNVAPFLGVSSTFRVCLVSEWMPHGTISTYLKAYPQADRLFLIKQIIDGLQYMHSRDIVHGDLKAANVLVSVNHTACLTDFGLATVNHNTGVISGTATGSTKGTLRWMSPELLGMLSDDLGKPTQESDIYALAMVLWEVFTGRIPFDNIRHEGQLFGKINEGFRPERPTEATVLGLSDEIWSSMTQAWSIDPHQRPTLDQLDALLLSQIDRNTHNPPDLILSQQDNTASHKTLTLNHRTIIQPPPGADVPAISTPFAHGQQQQQQPGELQLSAVRSVSQELSPSGGVYRGTSALEPTATHEPAMVTRHADPLSMDDLSGTNTEMTLPQAAGEHGHDTELIQFSFDEDSLRGDAFFNKIVNFWGPEVSGA